MARRQHEADRAAHRPLDPDVANDGRLEAAQHPFQRVEPAGDVQLGGAVPFGDRTILDRGLLIRGGDDDAGERGAGEVARFDAQRRGGILAGRGTGRQHHDARDGEAA
jgi:hypothetical protein